MSSQSRDQSGEGGGVRSVSGPIRREGGVMSVSGPIRREGGVSSVPWKYSDSSGGGGRGGGGGVMSVLEPNPTYDMQVLVRSAFLGPVRRRRNSHRPSMM